MERIDPFATLEEISKHFDSIDQTDPERLVVFLSDVVTRGFMECLMQGSSYEWEHAITKGEAAIMIKLPMPKDAIKALETHTPALQKAFDKMYGQTEMDANQVLGRALSNLIFIAICSQFEKSQKKEKS